jgi:hypothetical protein
MRGWRQIELFPSRSSCHVSPQATSKLVENGIDDLFRITTIEMRVQFADELSDRPS